MPVDPVSETLLNIILKEAQKEDKKQRKAGYWMLCPFCGKRVVKKQLIKNGCYLCKWKGIDEEIERAQAKQTSLLSKSRQVKSLNIENIHSYRINCPNCGKEVVTAQLKEKGCYMCGWKPTNKIRN